MTRQAIWTENVTSTSLGTGVTETLLNGGASFVLPAQARAMIEMKPYQAPTGAVTAAQSMIYKVKVKSNSIGGLEPKELVPAPIGAGLGATYHAQNPIVRAFRLNRNTPGANVNVDFYGQNLVANTVANRAGVGLKLSTMPVSGPEQFWFGPTDETDTVTTAGTGADTTFTINGGSQITDWYCQVTATTVTASESFIGYAELNSSDFETVQRVRWPFYPIVTSLSTLIGTTIPDQNWEHGSIPIRPTCNITTRVTLDEGQTAAGDSYVGVGFIRQ